jgi:hypothetical protein
MISKRPDNPYGGKDDRICMHVEPLKLFLNGLLNFYSVRCTSNPRIYKHIISHPCHARATARFMARLMPLIVPLGLAFGVHPAHPGVTCLAN